MNSNESRLSVSDSYLDASPSAIIGALPSSALNLAARGGTSPNSKPSLTLADAAAQISRANAPWGAAVGQATTVTYAFASENPGNQTDVGGWSRLSAGQMTAVNLALLAWSDVANITFQRVGSGSSGDAAYSNNATILLNNFLTGQSAKDSAAYAYAPGDRSSGSQDGDVWINVSDDNNVSGINIGGYGLTTLTHEIGHSLGLDHPGDYNAGEGSPTYEGSAKYYEDNKQYSLMSYFDESKAGADFKGFNAAAPMLDDIAAIQRLYGANTTTRTGDTVYGFNSNSARSWYSAASATDQMVFAVWDAGGNDTLDFSGYSQAQKIDLGQGNFSDVGGLKGNVAIAVGAVIENAIGGSGADTLTGNSADNRLTGGGGNDTLSGGAGTDTAIYSGARANYSATIGVDGAITIVDTRAGSPDGTDRLVSIEQLQFSDGMVTAAGLLTNAASLAAGVSAALTAVLRADQTSPLNAALVTAIGSQSAAAAMPLILVAARQTSSVATLAYEFFTGKAPSAGGMDYLVSPTGPNANNLNAAYYQDFSLENRYINFAVNLGKIGDGNANFTTKFGGLTIFEATRTAYATIFGEAPSDAKLHAILDPTTVLNGQTFTRSDYFAYYGQDGVNGIGTKAAMVGYLLAEAVKADVGTYAKSNDAFLTDVALNNAPFGVDLVGVYSQPSFVFHPG